MARFIKTISADGGTSGSGGSGVSLSEVCTAVCKVICDNTTRNASGIVEAADFSESGTYANRTNQIIPGFGCWEMICNCPYWDTCYGCCIEWCIDTTKYRAFNIVYSGIRQKPCCHLYPCWGFGTETCFCCCSQSYRGRSVLCGWPTHIGSNYQWTAYNCEHISGDYCIQCMNAEARDTVWGFQFMICAPEWKRTVSQNTGGGVFYDLRTTAKYMCNCNQYCYSDYSRFKGFNFCSCLFWNCTQNSNYYVSKMCLKVANQAFQSALVSGGSWTGCEGFPCATGVPCWTIWGQPCMRPQFGTCCIDTAG